MIPVPTNGNYQQSLNTSCQTYFEVYGVVDLHRQGLEPGLQPQVCGVELHRLGLDLLQVQVQVQPVDMLDTPPEQGNFVRIG